MPSSRALPSLATVVDRFLPPPGKNLDWRNELLLSDFKPSVFSPLPLLIRKKFLSFCGKGLWPLECLLDMEKEEKLRFSLGRVLPGEGEGEELWKRVVILNG